jgi:hypothetical protein
MQPKAPYILTEQEQVDLLVLISCTRVPSEYSSTLIKYAGEKRMSGLKSHDHHCLLQQILPTAVRNLLDKGVRETIMKVGHLFQQICSRVIDPKKTKELECFAVEAICLLELNFPPGLFDTMG